MTRWFPAECVGSVEFRRVRKVGFEASLCDQLVTRRLCANSSFSGECVRPVVSHPIVSDQLVLRRVFATS